MQRDDIERIKQRIFLRTLIALLVVGSVLVATVMIPLREALEEKNDREVHFTVSAKTAAVDQFVSKIVNLAGQFASRTQIRKKLDEYNQGKVDRQALAEFSAPKLLDALKSAEDAAGITRLDAAGKLAVAVGTALPVDFLQRFDAEHLTQERVYAPVVIAGEPFVIVATPIHERDGKRVGTDIVLFRTGALRNIVQDYTGLGETGEVILMYQDGDHFSSVFPPRRPFDVKVFDEMLRNYRQGGTVDTGHYHSCDGCVVTIRPVRGTDWHIVFRMTEHELNAIVDATTHRLLLISALVLIGGMIGIYRLTYPLLHSLAVELAERSRMLAELETNEQTLWQTQRRLEEDVLRRQQAEEELRLLNEELEQRVGQRTRELEDSHEELSQAYDDLKAAHSRMVQQEKLASIGQLAAGVAHELNNPLGFVLSNLGAIERYSADLIKYLRRQEEAVKQLGELVPAQAAVIDAELRQQRKALDIDATIADLGDVVTESMDGGNRMKQIILNLKSFARSEGQELRMADINEGLESTLNIVWNELKYKATVVKEYGELPRTLCNLGQLNQVFMNLLVNAAQAIDTKGEIRLQTRHDNGWIIVTVADTGCGIAADKLNRIFEPFFTTKDVGKGTGLGLSIAYDIVKKHDGEIGVDSELGKGTTFTVRIPVRTERADAEEPAV